LAALCAPSQDAPANAVVAIESITMNCTNPIWSEYQRRRFQRNNAHLYIRHDAHRWLLHDREQRHSLDQRLRPSFLEGKANFDPNQPRVPAGNRDGGQWTEGGGGDRQISQGGSTEFSAVRRNRAGGHHYVPRAIYKDKPLSADTRKVFDDATTGPIRLRATSEDGLLRGHFWDGPQGAHGQYSEAVDSLLKNYMNENGIAWETMTAEQARSFLDKVHRSQNPRIRDYIGSIRLLQRLYRFRVGGRGTE
jgi:hypothetical protein